MYIRIHPVNPEERKINQVVECLKNGGVIIYPTDTVYGLGCDIRNPKAIERLYRLKNVNQKTAKFSFVCKDISEMSDYIKNIGTNTFRLVKKSFPGPYTFIFEASKQVPKLLETKKQTVGIRIPDNKICMAIVEALGNPIISTSMPETYDVENYTDPEIFYELFENRVDIVIDGGIGGIATSTIIDFSTGDANIIREGLGNIDIFA